MQKESKVVIKVLVAFIIVLVLIMYLVYQLIVIETEEDGQSYEYEMQIVPEEKGNYTLYVPVIINEDGSVSELMQDINIIKGNATYEIIDTEHGKALKIVTDEEVRIKSSGQKRILWPYLSMLNATKEDRVQENGEVEFWVYCDKPVGSKNITLNIYFSAEVWSDTYNGLGMQKLNSGNFKDEQIEDVTVVTGWQKVPGYILKELAN